MDVLTPRSLDEALALKAEHPGRACRSRAAPTSWSRSTSTAPGPKPLLNLNEVAELRGWSRENGTLRLGAGLTYTEAM